MEFLDWQDSRSNVQFISSLRSEVPAFPPGFDPLIASVMVVVVVVVVLVVVAGQIAHPAP